MRKILFFTVILGALVNPVFSKKKEAKVAGFVLKSHDFTQNGKIPREFTCDGQDISPELHWENPPEGTQAFALIVDDPDAPDPKAPKMTWVHWVLYDIPKEINQLPRGVKDLPTGTREGLNDWKRTGYGGPCPPIGEHRYFFKLYALKEPIGDKGKLTKKELQKAMEGKVLAEAQLIGKYGPR